MFSELEISKDEDFRKHLNKYDVIHMDIQWFLANCKDVNHIVEFITKNIYLKLNYFLIVLEMEKSVFLLEQIIVWEEKVKRKQVNLELL